MKTLIIDNYDSFTFNLFQMVSQANGEEAMVIRNDSLNYNQIEKLSFDNIIISPGPGRPGREADFGVCADIIRYYKGPLLAVCLGHQGLCRYYGGKVINAPEVMHGRLSEISHSGAPLFKDIPTRFKVTRYHSLIVESLPEELELTAWTDEGLIMAVSHKSLPHYGLQFHPESICTDYGMTILENFKELTALYSTTGEKRVPSGQSSISPESTIIPLPVERKRAANSFKINCRPIKAAPPAELLFTALYGHDPEAIWLDSSKQDALERPCSIMGGSGGPHFFRVDYSVDRREIKISKGDEVETREGSIFDYLKEMEEQYRVPGSPTPFNFNCGFTGYFGYELKELTLGIKNRFSSTEPDATLFFLDRALIYDHKSGLIYLLALDVEGEERSVEWFDEVESKINELMGPSAPRESVKYLKPIQGIMPEAPLFRLSRPKERYIADIERCLEYINEGESYELCLTNKLRCETEMSPLLYHLKLRQINPAPYAVYMRAGEVAIAGSSIERFLHLDSEGNIETKPIKGTIARGKSEDEDRELKETLLNSVKDRAENLMIVDLLRNDLGIVCEIGSVTVPKLMRIESYATVHQMVSTVRGRLKRGLSPIDCIEQAFPGGSMTGAPKRRTIELMEELEGEARGVYSGAIGYIALNGSVDLNIVMRTALFNRGHYSAGIGGAIVALSDPEAEFEEILLKGKALRKSFE